MGLFNLKASKWAAFPILFFQFVNTGLLAPTLPDIIVPFFDNSYATASLAQGVCDSVGAFLAFVLSPMVGSLSDVYGRRPFLLLTVIITSAQVWTIALYPNISLYYYLVAKAFGKVSVFGPVLSYVADCTTTEDRTPAFGQAMASIFLALTTGPFVSMFTTPAIAFRIACICTIINCFYIIFILPESPATKAGGHRGSASSHGSIHTLHRDHHHNATASLPAPPPSSSAAVPPPPPYGTFTRQKSNELLPPTPTRSTSGSTIDMATVINASPDPSPPPTAGGSVRRAPVPLTPAMFPSAAVGSSSMLPSANPRARAEQRTLNPFRALKFAMRDPLYTSITLIVFFSQLSEYGVFETEPLYLRMMLNFQRDDRSHVMVVVGISTFTVMVVLMPWLLPRLRERRVIMLALFCNFVHVVLYAVIWEKSQVFLIALVGAIGYMSYPASSSLLSKNVSTKEQGAAQGALSGFKSLTQGFGPLLFSLIFSFFTSDTTPIYLPAAPFFLGAAFITVAFVVAAVLSDKPKEILYRHKAANIIDEHDTDPLLNITSDAHHGHGSNGYQHVAPNATIMTPKKVAQVAGSSFVITLTQHSPADASSPAPVITTPSASSSSTTSGNNGSGMSASSRVLDVTPPRKAELARSQSGIITRTPLRPSTEVIAEADEEPQS